MYTDLDAVFRKFLSGARAQRHTVEITRHYRSPGSSGYHTATRYVAEAIRDAGADEISEERYPLDGDTRFLGRTMPPAWEPLEATLTLIEPVREHLISYEEVPSTLPWWCTSTPDGGVDVQVVDVGHGLSAADYSGKPVEGNAVLIRDSESRPAWAHAAELARRHGAAGIITDFLHSQTPPWRTREALPDAVQLLRLPPRWDNAWAFSVGYRVAQHLADLIRRGPARVHASVRARTFRGEGVNLIGTIRGGDRARESVFFVAHTSAGTKPCANCAAGPSLMIELCRSIQAAIRAGAVPRPRRSLRFMFVAEGLGSSYFIHTHRADLADIKAVLCLDSVGHRQSTLKSSLVMYRSPDSVPGYVNDVGGALIEASMDAAWPFRAGPAISLVNFQQLPYTPWSDNHYWVTFGVQAPLFMSWPDLYFHTQLLTAEHTDPLVFERAGRVLGSLAVGIARAGPADAAPIIKEVAARSAYRLSRLTRDGLAELSQPGGEDGGSPASNALDRIGRHVRIVVERDAQAIRAAVALAGSDEGIDKMTQLADRAVQGLRRQADAELDGLAALAGIDAPPALSRAPDEGATPTPHRTSDGIAPGVVGLTYDEMAALVRAMQTEDAAVNWESLRIFGDELWNLADGRRTVAEIGEAICVEFGFRLGANHFLTLARGLEKAGLFRLEVAPVRSESGSLLHGDAHRR